MAVYAIGDLQGCLDPLQRLLEQIDFDPATDRLWFTGDLVNRGPASLETLRFVRSLGDQAITVLGNHDLHLLAAAWTGSRKGKRQDTLETILTAPDRDELLHWLRCRPLLHHDPALGFTMVHAGLPPQWDLAEATAAAAELQSVLAGDGTATFLEEMYGNLPNHWSPELRGIERLRFIVNALTRLRFLRPDGSLDLGSKGPADGARADLIPWFRYPGRRSAGMRIVFGHWSLLHGGKFDGAFGVDTGCVYGGKLTALNLGDLSSRCVDCAPGWHPKRRKSREKQSG
jgi:bis(5'-nucleosyl)-tetraphosphatase (symmetrical)